MREFSRFHRPTSLIPGLPLRAEWQVGCRRDSRNERLWNGSCWRILLKKSFPAYERNFSGALMRFTRRDVRDHNAFHKNDHGPSCRS
jgi:hypothetical protein